MLTVSGEDDQVHLRSLRDWLTREDLFRGHSSTATTGTVAS